MKGILTQRQNRAYGFIQAYIQQHHMPPTLQEIGDNLGIRSMNGVTKLLVVLEKKGYIVREKNIARGMRLADPEDLLADDGLLPNLPMMGQVHSAHPDDLRHRPARYFSVDPFFLQKADKSEACLIGRAQDDGLNLDGIRRGDYILIEETPWEGLKQNEIVAYLNLQNLYVRRFTFANNTWHLTSPDRNYMDESYAPTNEECHIIGRVLGVIRRL